MFLKDVKCRDINKYLLTAVQNVYALMICTPILSLRDCDICLNQSVRAYEKCCRGYQGGVAARPSCAFRWEIYPFSQAFDLPLAHPPRPPTSPTTKRGKLFYLMFAS
uniref:Cysteine-rich receptor-like protein kinase 14 n=1 Tax=Noccaea caerulescens TaxID=107243 RepID=A0A1J3JVF4_NOCCA